MTNSTFYNWFLPVWTIHFCQAFVRGFYSRLLPARGAPGGRMVCSLAAPPPLITIWLSSTPRPPLSPPAQLLLGGHFLGAQKCPISKSLSSISLFTVHAWELVVIRLLTRVRVFVTPWTAARQASRSFTIFRSLLKFMSVASVMLSKHLILCHPLLLLPSVFPSVRDFSHESSLYIRWSKYWRFSFSISHSDEYSGLISFRIDWFDLLAVQGTLKSLLQHHGSKASILWCSASLWSSSHIRTWLLEKP